MPVINSPSNARGVIMEFFRRLHFYIGLFVGPFIFIAALTGALYVRLRAGQTARMHAAVGRQRSIQSI